MAIALTRDVSGDRYPARGRRSNNNLSVLLTENN
ncbi:MAG: hypothetical protein RLZZ568_1374, partial [Cyanobacteriota bacterium]